MNVLQIQKPWLRVAWLTAIALVLLLGAFLFASLSVAADDGAPSNSGRLVSVHDRSETKTVLSHAATIGDVLKEASIHLDERDVVEPGLDEELVASEYQVNIYRARPVTIVDGAVKQRVITAHQTAQQIVDDARIVLYPEDRTSFRQATGIVDGAGLELVIDRAAQVRVSLYGVSTAVRTQGATIAELLSDKAITLHADDRVEPSLTTPITDGLEVRIWREGLQTVTVEESIDFTTERVYDADREVGYAAVKTAGVAGTRSVTYEVVVENGQEVSRQEIASLVVTQPVAQVEVVGTKVAVVAGDRAALMAAAGIAESDFGYVIDILNRENGLWCPTRWQGQRFCPTDFAESRPGQEASSQIGYGLCQATPANKMAAAGADWRTNPVTQLKWCHSYAIERYGSWQAAQAYSSCIGACYSPYAKAIVQKNSRWW